MAGDGRAHVRIEDVAADILPSAEALVPRWLPGGRREGREWRCGSLNGEAGQSLAVNLDTGRWGDFATGEKGGDLVSLYAAIHDMTQGAAAAALAKDHGTAPEAPRDRPKKAATKPPPKAPPIIPVPDDAPDPTLHHYRHGTPVARWAYRDAQGRPAFHVARYEPEAGRKEVLAWVWTADGWKCRHPPEGRPLYNLPALVAGKDRGVIVVEGEKAADAAQRMVGKGSIVVTWSSGTNAIAKSDWSQLRGRRVLLWPDADEPGLKAAAKLVEILRQVGVTSLREVRVEAGGGGWDLADGEAEGLTREQLVDRMKFAHVHWRDEAERDGAVPDAAPPPPEDGDPGHGGQVVDMTGQPVGEDRSWRRELSTSIEGAIRVNQRNAELYLSHYPSMLGVLGFDEMRQEATIMSAPPWAATEDDGPYPRQVTDADIAGAVYWLQDDAGAALWSISSRLVAPAIERAARRAPYHPLRDYLRGLEWDGVGRLDWLFVDYFECGDDDYTRAVGPMFTLGAVARAFRPGCKVDTMPIVEGEQGIRKSSGLRALCGPQFFIDSLSDLSGKDAIIQLQGSWIAEIGELAAMSRGQVDHVKMVLSRQEDEIRLPYGTRPVRLPRATVFVGTVNPEDGYLTDRTGNRRFYPLRAEAVDIEAIERDRDQLWAEAVHRFDAGEPWHPSPELAAAAIERQRGAEVRDVWEDRIGDWLRTRDRATTAEILTECIQMPPERQNRAAQMRVAGALKAMGWDRVRIRSEGARRYEFVRPGASPREDWQQAPLMTEDPDAFL